MILQVQPIRDSDNSMNPPLIEVTGNDQEVTFKMEWMERSITIALTDLRRIINFYEKEPWWSTK